MLLSGDKVLSSLRLNQIVKDQAQELLNKQPLLFLDRTAVVDADDDEITGSFAGRVLAADIIADDQEAVVHEGFGLTLATNNIPNIKTGTRIGQAMLNRLNRIRANRGGAGDADVFANFEQRAAANLIIGVRQRMNALICSMMLDSTVYNRLGVQINGSWGMPNDLKVTPTNLWSDAANATPITDILTLVDYAATTYGESYDRITLSTAAFRQAIKTAEFKNLLPGLFKAAVPSTAFNALQGQMKGWLSDVLNGMEIEISDTKYQTRTEAGTLTTTAVQPVNKVILSSRSDDNNAATWDFANGIVTESIVAGLVGNYDLGGEQFGPVGYYTGRPDLNPPDVRAWAVARGFPRKHRATASAVLTVAA